MHSSQHLEQIAPLGALTLTVRFLLELAALGALGWWGWRVGGPALGVATPLAAAVLWGTFVSPKATIAIGVIPRFGLELLVFGGAAVALLVIGETTLGAVFAAVAAVNLGLVYALEL